METNTQTVAITKAGRNSQPFIIATAFLSMLAIVGFAYYGVPFYFDFMMKDFGWSSATVTSGNAVAKLVVGILFGFITGYLIDKYGPRRMLMAGALLGGLSLFGLGSLNGSLWTFYLFYIFNALGYVLGGPLPCQVLISRWFDGNRGKAMGIAYLGIGIGGAVAPLLSRAMIASFGWHQALCGLGLLVILIAFPFSFFVKDNSQFVASETKEKEKVPMKNILKSRNFYLLGIGSMCSIAAVGGVIQHLKIYLVSNNFDQSQAANVMSLILWSSLVGRILMGTLADIIHRKYVMILIYTIVGSAISLLLVPDFPGRIYIFAVIFGIGLGGDYMIVPLMAGDLFGVKALGRTMGIILIADVISEANFPVIVGKIHDVTHSYSLGFSLLICMALLGTLIVSFLPDTRKKAAKEMALEH
jgi:MFS family permease